MLRCNTAYPPSTCTAAIIFVSICTFCCLAASPSYLAFAFAPTDDSGGPYAATFPVVYSGGAPRTSRITTRNKAVMRQLNAVAESAPPIGIANASAERAVSSDRLQFPLAASAEGFGEYLAVLRLGSPAQKVAVAIDTGSQLLWVQCHPCIECGAQAQGFDIFDPSKSNSYSPVTCDDCRGDSSVATACSSHAAREPRLLAAAENGERCIYAVTYGDRSNSTGFLSAETLSIASSGSQIGGGAARLHDVVFGCGLINTGLVSTLSASGLLGLDRGRFSLISQLRVDTFSYCLPRRRSGGGGFLTLGPAAVPDLQYTPLYQSTESEFHSQFYYLNLTGISVAGNRLQIPEAPFDSNGEVAATSTIIDSGTTMTSLVHEAYEALAQAFDEGMAGSGAEKVPAEVEAPLSLCYRVPTWWGQPPSPPEVTLHFAGGADLRLREHHVLAYIGADTSSRYYCMAFIDSGSSHTAANYIGNFQQQDILVEYDLGRSRIGFAPSTYTCSSGSGADGRRTAAALLVMNILLLLYRFDMKVQ